MGEINKYHISIGPGLIGCLTLLFIALKLIGHIDWSWWWVLSPIWLPIAIIVALAVMVFVICMIIYLITDWW